MKGLIIKDFLMLKTMFRTYIILILFYGAMGAINNMGPMLLCIIPIMMLSSLGSLDEKSNFYRYAKTMPIKQKHVVLSRYFIILLALLFCLVLCVILSAISSIFGQSFENQFISSLSSLVVSAIIIPVLYPLQLKFGVEKARIWLILTFVIAGGAIGLITYAAVTSNITNIAFIIPFAILLTIILWVVSVRMSENIFATKEF